MCIFCGRASQKLLSKFCRHCVSLYIYLIIYLFGVLRRTPEYLTYTVVISIMVAGTTDMHAEPGGIPQQSAGCCKIIAENKNTFWHLSDLSAISICIALHNSILFKMSGGSGSIIHARFDENAKI